MKQPNGMVLNPDLIAEVTFNICASLHDDCGGGENFVHEILGKISVRNVDNETEEPAGEVNASLVQFKEAQIHGISCRVLGDGCSQEISNCWQELFDHDEDEFKAEIQRGWQTEGTNLLIISAIQVSPRFEASAIGLAALGRTVELFGRSCDLVACFPEGIESYLPPGSSQSTLPQTPREMANGVAELKDNCLKAGFRAWADSGIYLLNPGRMRTDTLLE